MLKLFLTIIIVAFPTYLYAWLVRSIDRFEKEPTSYLLGAFLWGALPSIILGIILQGMLSIPVGYALGEGSLAGTFAMAAIAAPVTEEILKAIVVAIIYFTWRREFDGWVDGIVYGATAGFGFAYVENILYLMGTETPQDWIVLFFLRVIILGFMHGFWTSLTGIGFGLARYMHNLFGKVLVITGGLIAAIAGHLIHNGALVFAEATQGATVLIAILNYALLGGLIVVLSIVAGIHERGTMRVYLREEVPNNLSQEDYQGLCGGNRIRIAPQRKRLLTQAAAELAQKKLQLAKMGEEGGNSSEIQQLQTHLRELSLG